MTSMMKTSFGHRGGNGADQLTRFIGVIQQHLYDRVDLNVVVIWMPAIKVGHHGHCAVRNLSLTGKFGFRHVGHADHITVVIGAKEEFDPNPLFSVRFYLNAYPDVRQSQINPLIHYSLKPFLLSFRCLGFCKCFRDPLVSVIDVLVESAARLGF